MIKCKLGACWAAPCRLHHHLPYVLQTDGFWGTTSLPAEFSYTARNRGMGLEVPSVPLEPSPSWTSISREAQSADLAAHPRAASSSQPASRDHISPGDTRGDNSTRLHQGYVVQCSRSGTGFMGLAKTNENKKKRRKERNSGVGGDTVAAPSALCPGVAHRVKQPRHLAGRGVKPICNTSPGL